MSLFVDAFRFSLSGNPYYRLSYARLRRHLRVGASWNGRVVVGAVRNLNGNNMRRGGSGGVQAGKLGSWRAGCGCQRRFCMTAWMTEVT